MWEYFVQQKPVFPIQAGPAAPWIVWSRRQPLPRLGINTRILQVGSPNLASSLDALPRIVFRHGADAGRSRHCCTVHSNPEVATFREIKVSVCREGRPPVGQALFCAIRKTVLDFDAGCDLLHGGKTA
jgi:hypothetical protein